MFSSDTTSMLLSESTATALKLGLGSLMKRSGARSMTTGFLSAWACMRIPYASQTRSPANTKRRVLFIIASYLPSEDFRNRKRQDAVQTHIGEDDFLIFRVQHHSEGFPQRRLRPDGDLPFRRNIPVIVVSPDSEKCVGRLHLIDKSRHGRDGQFLWRINRHLVDSNNPRFRAADDGSGFHVAAVGA